MEYRRLEGAEGLLLDMNSVRFWLKIGLFCEITSCGEKRIFLVSDKNMWLTSGCVGGGASRLFSAIFYVPSRTF